MLNEFNILWLVLKVLKHRVKLSLFTILSFKYRNTFWRSYNKSYMISV
jgi:hypothetical protein